MQPREGLSRHRVGAVEEAKVPTDSPLAAVESDCDQTSQPTVPLEPHGHRPQRLCGYTCDIYIYIYILRRYKICSSVKFGSSTPFEIFNACVVSIFHCGTEGPCMAPCLSTGLLVRQKGYGYVLSLKSPLPKYTATLSCVELCSATPVIRFLTEF